MNDLTQWKIIDLHRRGADKTVWYFGVTKPDGKRLYAQSRGSSSPIYSAKAPSPVKIYAVDGDRYSGTSTLQVNALSEAGAVRKIMRYVDALATDWNTREMIKNAGMKQINFDKRKPDIIPADRQLEAPKAKEEPKPKVEEDYGRMRMNDLYRRLRDEGRFG